MIDHSKEPNLPIRSSWNDYKIKLKWTKKQIEEAEKMTDEMMKSDLDGKLKYPETFSGNIFHICVADFLKVPYLKGYGCDIKLTSGITLECKCKRVTQDVPGPNHYNEVYRIGQNSDFIVFGQNIPEMELSIIMGYISTKEFMDNCYFVRAHVDKPKDNHSEVSDNWCIRSKYLNPIQNCVEDFGGKRKAIQTNGILTF
jgi:hypothetical protein